MKYENFDSDKENITKICRLFNIDISSCFVLPLIYRSGHMRMSADYFIGDRLLYDRIMNTVFSDKPSALVSEGNRSYISLDVIVECLETGRYIN